MVTGRIMQTYQGMKACYQIILENRPYADAEVPYNVACGKILCNIPEKKSYSLIYDFRNSLSNWEKEIQRREYLDYRILDENGYDTGNICQKQTKGFLERYSYHDMSFEGQTYHIYCIPLGKEGLKYPMYLLDCNQKEIQVGLMEKPCIVDDMLDTYDFRVKEKGYVAPLVLYALYIDILYYGNRGKIPVKSKEVTYKITFNKRLKEKYHLSF